MTKKKKKRPLPLILIFFLRIIQTHRYNLTTITAPNRPAPLFWIPVAGESGDLRDLRKQNHESLFLIESRDSNLKFKKWKSGQNGSFSCFFAYQFVSESHMFLRLLPLFKEIRTFKLEEDVHVVRCSRERSRAAWKVIEEYLMPFVEQERYKISSGCRLHPDNDLYRDQEQHKHHLDINEWRCGYCRKNFYEEKYLDKHFDNRHFDLLNTSHSRCLADLCGALHCDLVMDSSLRKTKCNPAAAARNKHLCESLADSCFPVSKGPVSGRLHEFFLRQFCDAHTCSGGPKPFPKGQKNRTSMLYISLSVLTLMLLPLFYFFIYLYQRGIKSGSQELKRISLSGRKKKSF